MFESARGLTYPTSAPVVQGVFVAIGALAQVVAAGANAPGVVGVSLEATALTTDDVPYAVGDTISIAAMDGAKVEMLVGAAGITAGEDITSDSTGRAVPAAGTERIFGYAIDSGTVDEFATVVLLKGALAAA